ncbi:MAG: tRNA adenosine(34) deaminase TadA [Phycisphaerae bacterium]|nr:tRNA adenosine(34) deaminase TadA [Phycisphaerae bacterium]
MTMGMLDEDDERFMGEALKEAQDADAADEVPVGAVVIRYGRVIGRGHNQRQQLSDPTAHAEMIALTAAAAFVGDWRLSECTMYVTLEPCAMCAGAMVLARIERLVFGAEDPKTGACGSLYTITSDPRSNHQVKVTSGVLEEESRRLLQEFFQRQRALGKK